MGCFTKNLRAVIAKSIVVCMVFTYFFGNPDFAKAAIGSMAKTLAVSTGHDAQFNSGDFDEFQLVESSQSNILAFLDSPYEMEKVGDTVTVSGWAISLDAKSQEIGSIGSIVVEVGGIVTTAERFYRPDVENAIGGDYDFSLCGYAAEIDISGLETGKTYTLTVRIMDSNPNWASVLGSLSRDIVKHISVAKPLIACLDTPAESQTSNGFVTVSGWALYTLDGISNNIGRVEVSVASRVTVADLYIREDVKNALPGYGDYENSAFTAQVDISGLTGTLTLEIFIYDRNGSLMCTFTRTVISGEAPQPYISVLDTPVEESSFTDSLDVAGWALYTENGLTNDITSVRVQIADISQDAELSIREDVKKAVHGYGDYENSGFSTSIDTGRLPAGRYILYVYVYGEGGVLLGSHSRNIVKEDGGSNVEGFFMASAGLYHSMGLKSDGSVWTWGENIHGQLGDGTTKDSAIPKMVLENVVSVSASVYSSSYAIKQDGTLWAWGNNYYGKLGDGTANPKTLPVMVMENVTSVSAGMDHAAAITQDGALWTWGSNYSLQLGTGTYGMSYVPVRIMEDVKSVSAGTAYTMAVKNDGSLWAWGNNRYGKFGNGTTENSPTPIKIMDGVASVSVGGEHTMILMEDGSLWMCGLNHAGQLGDGTGTQSSIPVKIMDNVVSISAGYDFSTAITVDGSLWTWGNNESGRLGDGSNSNNRNVPQIILGDIVYCSAGQNYALAIKTDGTLWAWGNNLYGQLGNGASAHTLTPEAVMNDVILVSAGTSYTAAIKADGTLWTWGSNTYGQLGNGTWEKSALPVKILDNVVFISTGMYHMAAVLSDGSLWTWGTNYYGQLGDGTTTTSTIPVKIMDDVSSVSLGYTHTAAVKTDGSLWAWGENYYGQIGDSTNTNSFIPVKIMDGISSVSAGSYHTAAVGTDGSLWTWGVNWYGQLGDGTTASSSVPVKVMDDVSSASSGEYYTVAVKLDGSLWAWGSNSYGQLGNSGLGYAGVTIPEKIIDSGVASATSGSKSTFAVFSDGSLWAWGDNAHGQLGDGTQRNEIRDPVRIMDNVSIISVGDSHSAAILNGTLHTWGYNNYNQLGNDFIIGVRTPILITAE